MQRKTRYGPDFQRVYNLLIKNRKKNNYRIINSSECCGNTKEEETDLGQRRRYEKGCVEKEMAFKLRRGRGRKQGEGQMESGPQTEYRRSLVTQEAVADLKHGPQILCLSSPPEVECIFPPLEPGCVTA